MKKFTATVEVLVQVEVDLHANDLNHAVEKAARLSSGAGARGLIREESWVDSNLYVRGVYDCTTALNNG